MTDLDDIRLVLDRRIDALRHRDARSANEALHPDLVAFEAVGPLQVPPAEATDAAITQAWLDSFAEGPNVTMAELAIHSDGTVAFCHSLNRLQGRRTDGQDIDVTMRSTLGLVKVGNAWKIIHGHTSLPR